MSVPRLDSYRSDFLCGYLEEFVGHHAEQKFPPTQQDLDFIAEAIKLLRSAGSVDNAALWDRCRLDYLAAEKAEEEIDIAKIGHVKMHSVFRRNVPITRDAIDDAMRFRESINGERDSRGATPSYTEKT